MIYFGQVKLGQSAYVRAQRACLTCRAEARPYDFDLV
jgi:hypothetical protein